MAYSEYTMENINIEESKILVDNKWFTLNELKTNIKNKVNSDDFNVANLTNAVLELEEALKNVSQVKLTLHVDLIKYFKELATSSGTTFENTLRDALISQVDYGLTPTMTKAAGKSKVSPPSGKTKSTEKTPGYKPKKVAFFFTCAVDNKITAFEDMENICGVKPVATLRIDKKDMGDLENSEKVKEFVKSLLIWF